jgi:hypothetical protein
MIREIKNKSDAAEDAVVGHDSGFKDLVQK